MKILLKRFYHAEKQKDDAWRQRMIIDVYCTKGFFYSSF